MIVHESLLPSDSLDGVRVRRTSAGNPVKAHALPDVESCPSVFHEQLECCPAIACLKSLDLNVQWKNESFLVNFPSGSQTIELGGVFIELVQDSDNALSDACQLMLEMIGRWALAQHVLDSREALKADAEKGTSARWFLLRPLLHSIWQGHYTFDAPFVQLFLKTFFDSQQIRSFSEILNVENSYGDVLEAALSEIINSPGSARSAREDVLEIEQKRFLPPDGKHIAYFRSYRDGFILPIFAKPGFKFISKYRPNVRVQDNTSGSLHTSDQFESNFAEDDLRYPCHVPLSIRTNERLSKTFGPYVDCLPTPFSNLLRHPNVYFVTGEKDKTDEGDSEYSVLINSAPLVHSNRILGTSGRTGVLFRRGLPLVVELDGFQYLVEIKGMGCPDGGFPLIARRAAGRWSVLGGLLQSYAQDEFSSLCEMDQRTPAEEGSIKPVCLISIDTPALLDDPMVLTNDSEYSQLSAQSQRVQILKELGEQQSMLVRLTPAVERLSFVPWIPTFPRGDKEEIKKVRSLGGLSLEERVTCYGTMLARLLKAPCGQGHLAAHMENILAGSYVPAWQDFADVVDLYVSRSHYADPRWVDRRSLTLNVLNRTFYHMAQTSKLLHDSFGLGYTRFSVLFYRAFALELCGESKLAIDPARQMVEALEPLRLRDKRGITGYLWDEYFALDNYLWCTQNYDLPAAIFGSGADGSATVDSRELMLTFIHSEIAFLSQAKHIARSPELIAELEENLSAAHTLLNDAQEKQLTELPLLPYLKKSQTAPRPRKPKSWSP
jgi:hypothetical protein